MLLASSVAVTHRALATVDLVIIGVYFAIVFGIGMYFARKERTSEDYFLAGRDVGWFFIGASLFVSNISTEHFIGLSGTGASSGPAQEVVDEIRKAGGEAIANGNDVSDLFCSRSGPGRELEGKERLLQWSSG